MGFCRFKKLPTRELGEGAANGKQHRFSSTSVCRKNGRGPVELLTGGLRITSSDFASDSGDHVKVNGRLQSMFQKFVPITGINVPLAFAASIRSKRVSKSFDTD
jgi:hypothetical protein